MKQTVVDVLMYLFESYMENEDDMDPDPDRDMLQSKLVEAGFRPKEIEKAFDWLEGLSDFQEGPELRDPAPKTTRVLHPLELSKMGPECHGFLVFLEHAEILSPLARELVIDRVMALDEEEIDLEQFKWIVMMVLFNLPGEEASYNSMENLVLEEPGPHIH